jgi:hypothetical protein
MLMANKPDLNRVDSSKQSQQNETSSSGVNQPSATVVSTPQKSKHYKLFTNFKLLAAVLTGLIIVVLVALSPFHNQAISTAQPIIILLSLIAVNVFILKNLHYRRVIYKVLLEILIIIILVPVSVIILLIVAIEKSSYDHRPAVVKAAYTQTANKDANIILSGTPVAYLYKKISLPLTTNSATDTLNINRNYNEVHNLYCYTVPISDSSNIISDLNTGLYNVPVTRQGFNYDYYKVAGWPSSQTSSDTSSGANGTTDQFNNNLQSQFNKNDQIDMPFSIGGGDGNGNESYNGAIALKTTNPNFYPAADIDIKVNTLKQSGQCVELAKQIGTTNKLVVSIDADLVDNPTAEGIFSGDNF